MHSKLRNEYRKREQELMIEQLRSDPKTVPKPSRDEMMRMLYEKPRQAKGKRHYIQAKRNVKERIRLTKSTNEQPRIED